MAKLLSGTRIYGTANVDSTLYVNGTTASTSNTTGALVVSGGVGVSGNVYATGLYDNGIEVLVYAQVVSNVANSATANTIVTQGVDATQNTRLTVIEGTDVSQNSRIDYSNTAITIIQGVDVSQNTAIAATDGKMQSAYDQANTGTVLAQASYNQANVTIGVDATQNTNIASTDGKMQSAYNKANTGGLFSGDVTITGNLVVNGVTTSVNTSTITTSDSLIKLANNNTAGDSVDIGFYGTYNSSGQKYAGLVRQAGSNFFLFKDITTDPTANTLPAGSLTGANTGILSANIVGYITSNGYSLYDYTTSLYNLANTHSNQIVVIQGTDVSQNARIDYSNSAITIIQGTDVGQNTRLTVIEGTDVSQNVRLDYSNTAIAIIQGVDLGQNTAIAATDGKMQSAYNQANTGTVLAQAAYNQSNASFLGVNTAITIIQGVDLGQNTSIAATNQYATSAFSTANNALPNVGPVITVNSSSRLIVSNTTTSTSNTTGALVVNGGVGVAGQLTAQQVVAQNLLATGFVQSPYQIVAPKGMINTGPVTGSATFYTGTSTSYVYGASCDPTGSFIYISSLFNSTVSQYSINQTTGALTSITTPIATGANPAGVACDPTGRFVYVSNYIAGSVSQYSINQTTGALTSLGADIAANTQPFTLACESTGRFVYVANYGASTVSQYSINQTTGVLTSIGADIATSGTARVITCDPTGRFVYVSCVSSNTISMYSINQTTGVLTSITTAISLPSAGGAISCEPTGKFVFAATTTTVNTFSINQTTGALTFVGSYTTFGAVTVLTPDPAGKLLYLINNGGTLLTPISINPYNGMLYNPQAYQIITGGTMSAFTVASIDPTGRFLYLPAMNNTLTCYLFIGSFSTGFANFGSAKALNFNNGLTTTVSAASYTGMTTASTYFQQLTGTLNQSFFLPVATSLSIGTAFLFSNDSTGVLSVYDSDPVFIKSIQSGSAFLFYLLDNSTTAGVWAKYEYLPKSYDFNATTANFGSAAITTTGTVTAQNIFNPFLLAGM